MTSNPVESGAEVSDHVVRKPDKLTIAGIISDTPVSLLGIASTSKAARNNLSPVKYGYQFLNALMESRIPFDFAGIMQVYKQYVLTSWNPIATAKDGSWLKFTAQMQRVIIVNSQTVINANLKDPKTGGTKGSLGTQSTSKFTGQPLHVDSAGNYLPPTELTSGDFIPGGTGLNFSSFIYELTQ